MIDYREMSDEELKYLAPMHRLGERARHELCRRTRLRHDSTCLNCEFELSLKGGDFCEICDQDFDK